MPSPLQEGHRRTSGCPGLAMALEGLVLAVVAGLDGVRDEPPNGGFVTVFAWLCHYVSFYDIRHRRLALHEAPTVTVLFFSIDDEV